MKLTEEERIKRRRESKRRYYMKTIGNDVAKRRLENEIKKEKKREEKDRIKELKKIEAEKEFEEAFKLIDIVSKINKSKIVQFQKNKDFEFGAKLMRVCVCCGYHYHLALHNHHINRKESDDTVLLCANCHLLLHNNGRGIKKNYSSSIKDIVTQIVQKKKNLDIKYNQIMNDYENSIL